MILPALLLAAAAFAAEPPAPALPPKLDLRRMSGVSFMLAGSPDGSILAAGDPGGVSLWKMGATRPFGRIDWTTSTKDDQPVNVFPLAISRDNSRVFFMRNGNVNVELAIGDVRSGKIIASAPSRKRHCRDSKHSMYSCEGNGSGTFSPDGREAIYRAYYNGADDTSITEDQVLTDGGKFKTVLRLQRNFSDGIGWLDEKGGAQSECQYGPDGARLAARADGAFCSIVECDSGKRRVFLDGCDLAHFRNPAMSLDGTRVIGNRKDDKGIVLWDAVDGRILNDYKFRSEAPYALDQRDTDLYGRYLVEEHELKQGENVVAARLNLVELDSGKLLDTTESALDKGGLYLRSVASDGTALFQADKGNVVIWSFKKKAEAGPAAVVAAPVAAAPGVDVDKAPVSSLKRDPDAYAVVIGVERYRQSGIPVVDYASRDAGTMRDYLVGAMGYDPKNVILLTDASATKTDFDKHLGKWLRNRVEAKSRVFIYYAGHGAPDPATGAAYLMPYEADPSYLEDTAYPLTKLYAELEKLPTKAVTVVLDACFSGQGPRSLLAKGARPLVTAMAAASPGGMRVIAAASSSQISLSDPEARHGLLTYYLLEGLHGGADADKDGTVTADEAFAYAKPAVERAARLQNAEQTPNSAGAADARPWVVLKK